MRSFLNHLQDAALRSMPQHSVCRTLGRLARVPLPAPVIRTLTAGYRRIYDVDMRDSLVPAAGFRSFDEFFTRALQPAARCIDDHPETIISPCDGRLDDEGLIESEGRFVVKGDPYSVAGLLGSAPDGAAFAGGRYFILYLAPRDYHRVHAPLDGQLMQIRHIAGSRYPVNRLGVRAVPGLFAKNERLCFFFRTAQHEQAALVMVAAWGVGHMSTSPALSSLPTVVRRGQELGVFHLGSTVVLLLDAAASARALSRVGDRVRMGGALALRIADNGHHGA